MASETDNSQVEQQQPPTTDNNSDDVVSIDLPAPTGWLKKFTPKKGGTPRRNEIVFIAPTGEEIKNNNQLRKYLKSHSGGPSLSEFDWSTGDTPRRSSRLRNNPEATETPESGSSRKKQKRSGSKVEAEKEETDNGDSDENDASTGKTEVEKDVEMKDVEDAPVEKKTDDEKAPVEETADEEKAPLEKTADEKAPVEKAADEEKAPAEKTADEVEAPAEKTADEVGAPVPEEVAGQGNTQLPEETAAPGRVEELPAEHKVESVTEQVEPQVSLETAIQPEDNKAEAGGNHFNIALPENKNAVNKQSAGNNEGSEKESAGDQPEAYNLTINDYTDGFEAVPTHTGVENFETNNTQEDLEKKMSSEEVGADNNNSTKNQEAVKHTENDSVIADNTTHESSVAPSISC